MNPVLYPSNVPLDYEAYIYISSGKVPKFILTPSTTNYKFNGPSRPGGSLESFLSGLF